MMYVKHEITIDLTRNKTFSNINIKQKNDNLVL